MNRRKMVTMGLLAAVLVCGLALAGCKDAEANPFVGVWATAGDALTLTFTETTWTMSSNVDAQLNQNGTYTRSGTTATLSITIENQTGTLGTATVNGNTLTATVAGNPLTLTKK
jgi:hypothetical protein